MRPTCFILFLAAAFCWSAPFLGADGKGDAGSDPEYVRIAYQGRLEGDADERRFKFALIDGAGILHWHSEGAVEEPYEPVDPVDGEYIPAPESDGVAVPLTGGFFSVLLGDESMAPLPAAVFETDPLFLRVWVDSDDDGFSRLGADLAINPVPRAVQARAAARAAFADIAAQANVAARAEAIADDSVSLGSLAPAVKEKIDEIDGKASQSDLSELRDAVDEMKEKVLPPKGVIGQLERLLALLDPASPAEGLQPVLLVDDVVRVEAGKPLDYMVRFLYATHVRFADGYSPPAGLTLQPSTGLLRWNGDDGPAADDVGLHKIKLVAENPYTRPEPDEENGEGGGDEPSLPSGAVKATLRIAVSPQGMAFIPAGSFWMGNPFSAVGFLDEQPLHRVELTRSFFMDINEVSREKYLEVREYAQERGYVNLGNPRSAPNNHPVSGSGISWYTAIAWCNLRCEVEGLDPVYFVTRGPGATRILRESWPTNRSFTVKLETVGGGQQQFAFFEEDGSRVDGGDIELLRGATYTFLRDYPTPDDPAEDEAFALSWGGQAPLDELNPSMTITFGASAPDSISYYSARSGSNIPAGALTVVSISMDPGANGYRLPTEAEWEYAARGGQEMRMYPWGDDEVTPFWLNSSSGYVPVDEDYPKNGFGLNQMAGNVEEWVWDWYSSNYYFISPGVDPRNDVEPSFNPSKVIRGGHAGGSADRFRVSHRGLSGPETGSNSIGFRTVRTITEE